MWIEIVLAILVLLGILRIVKKPSNYPPGPWGFPLIGYLPLSLANFDVKFQELKKKHGKIFSWRIGSRIIVFLCDWKLIKEAYNSPVFTIRPPLGFVSFLVDEYEIGVVHTNGSHWHNTRRFISRHLRDLGMGKSKIVSAVQYEAMEFVEELKKQAGTPAQLPRTLKPAILNVLWQMIASRRFEYNHKTLVEFDNIVQQMLENMTKIVILDIFTSIKTVVPKFILDSIPVKRLHIKLSKTLVKFFEIEIEDHISTLDENNPRDFIDDYLIEMEKQKSNPESTMSTRDLTGCISDLFGAGTETTSATIYFCLLFLARYPDIQRKLQKEIDSALPDETLATLDDKSRLPYTEAFINEILRYTTLAQFGIPHTVENDVIFEGYTIPKGAIILSATESLHFDPVYFDSPKEFRPERFLNSEGKVHIPKAGFFPFGIGKRQCLGESLARMEFYIFITTMLKYLNFSAPPNKEIDVRPLDIPVFSEPRVHQEIMITIR